MIIAAVAIGGYKTVTTFFATVRVKASTRRRFGLTAVLVVVAAVSVTTMLFSPAAQAVTQGGYTFNDAWTLSNPRSAATTNSEVSTAATATDVASTSIPLGAGAVDVAAVFTQGAGMVPGTAYLTEGANQGSYGATSAMLTGAPAPAALPALGVITSASACGGEPGTAQHLDFSGSCTGVGTLTLTFSEPVTNPTMDISGLGGFEQTDAPTTGAGRGSFISTRWTITSPGVTFADLSSGSTNLAISDGTQLGVAENRSNTRCDSTASSSSGTTRSPDEVTAGCGSVTLDGTFTTVSFRLDSEVHPYSEFPAATFNTGSAFFADSGAGGDGVNGANGLAGTTAGLPLYDLQRVSLRLAVPASIGNLVFNDVNANGVYDAGTDMTVAGAQVVLQMLQGGDWVAALDNNGASVAPVTTSASGIYDFTDLSPNRQYRVQFTAPSGFSYTTVGSTAAQNAGDAVDNDSNAIPSTGGVAVSPTITLSPGETNTTIDAGLVTNAAATPTPTPSTPAASAGFSSSTPVPTPTGQLADTGSSTGKAVWIALALLALGLPLSFRRRQQDSHN